MNLGNGWRFIREGLVAVLLLVGGGLALFAQVSVPAVPADNPYAPAYAAIARLSQEDRIAVAQGKPLSADAVSIGGEVSRALAAGRQAASVDWGLDYAKGTGMNMPHITGLRQISRLALASTEKASTSDLVDRSLDVLALARHAGRENIVILMMMQRALEQQTATFLQKNLSRLSPDDARRLLAGMETLPSGADLKETLKREKAVFADALLNEVRIVLAPLDEKQPAPTSEEEPLRMTAIVSEGRAPLIGFELNGEAFWLKPGQSRREVTLLRVDIEKDQAFLVRNERMVSLKLSAKKIVPIDLSLLAEAIKTAPENSPLRMLEVADVKEHGAEFVRMLELTSAQLDEIYTEVTAHPERFENNESFKNRLQALTPLARMSAEMLPQIIANERRAVEKAAALRASLVTLSQSSK